MRALCLVGVAVSAAGCLSVASIPGVQPEAAAPAAVDRLWKPPQPPEASLASLPVENRGLDVSSSPAGGGPLELAQLVSVALERNPDTRRAWQQARVAAAQVGIATAPYYPRLGAVVAGGPERFENRTSPAATTVHQDQAVSLVSLGWTLIDFGRRSSGLEEARQRLLVAGLGFNRRIQEVVFQTQTAFFLYDAARARVDAAEQNLELARTVREAVEDRLALGLATEPAALLARQAEARAAYDLEDTRASVSDTRARLALAIGIPANAPFEAASLSSLPTPPALDGDVDALIDATVRQRPDLAARVAEIRAREAATDKVRAEFYPELSFTGSYGLDASRFTANGGPRERVDSPVYAAGLGLRWKLLEGFEWLNAVKRAEADAAIARADLVSAELEAVAATWRAFHDYRAARKKLQFAEALLRASQDAYDSNVETYRQGLSTVTELLRAETDLAGARDSLVDSRAQVLLTSAAIAYVTGAIDPAGDGGS